MEFYVDVFGWLNVQATTPKGKTWTKTLKISEHEFEHYYALFKMHLEQKKNERKEKQEKNRRAD